MDDPEAVERALVGGKAEFMGNEFFVERGVLVPRSVTEVLIRAGRKLLEGCQPRIIADLGCGSGILSVMLALTFPELRVVALDIWPDAVRLTQRNVEKYGLGERVEVHESDMFGAIGDLTGKLDAIVSSPPFISSGQLAKGRAELLVHEPREAFDAGPYGIAIHQRLVKEGASMLRPDTGWLIVEFGEGQARQVRRLVERSGEYADLQEFREATGSFVACVAARRTAA